MSESDEPKRISERHIQTVCLMVLATVAAGFSLYWLRPILVPFVVATFVVSGIGPLLASIENRLGVSRLIAAGLTFLFGVAIMAAFGLTVWVSILDWQINSAAYRQRVLDLVLKVGDRVPFDYLSPDSFWLSTGDPEIDQVELEARDRERKRKAARIVDSIVRDGITSVSQAFLSLVSTSVVVLIYVFFLLLGKPAYTDTSILREIDAGIRRYLSLKTVISIVTGGVFGLALYLFGVPMALSFGLLAFLLNYIPNIGPIVASLLPVPLITLDPSGSVTWMVSAIATTCAIQFISGSVVEPKLMGDSSDLHPVTILLALMFWGTMWGIIGMFLATPITAAIKIVLQKFEPTRQVANVMAGRWEPK